jgi:hypothetical protein
MKENQNHMDVNHLWNHFKDSTTDSIKKNIPTKSTGIKTSLGQKSYFQCNSSMNYAFLSGVLI